MRHVLAGTGAAALAGVIGWTAWWAGSSTPTLYDGQQLQALPESELPQLVQAKEASEPPVVRSDAPQIQLIGWTAARRRPTTNQSDATFAEPGSLPLADSSARPLTAAESPAELLPINTEQPPLAWHQPKRSQAKPFLERESSWEASSDLRTNPLRSDAATSQVHATAHHALPSQLPWRDNPLR